MSRGRWPSLGNVLWLCAGLTIACSAGEVKALERPVTVHVPPSYEEGTPTPLVILLHGYTASGEVQERYLQLTPLADARGFLYVHPDGVVDGQGNRFWNANPVCCDFEGTGVDDVDYLTRLVDDIKARYSVDPKRVFLVGHSNGGGMALRLACERAEIFAAVVELAGMESQNGMTCRPGEPVSILHVHGTADTVIDYQGGQIAGRRYTSVPNLLARWAARNGCGSVPRTGVGPAFDLDRTDPTETEIYPDCRQSDVQHWRLPGSGHVPNVSPAFAPAIIDFLYAHPKP